MCLGFIFLLKKSPIILSHEKPTVESSCMVCLRSRHQQLHRCVSVSRYRTSCCSPTQRELLDIPDANDATFEGAISSWPWDSFCWLSLAVSPENQSFLLSPNLQFSRDSGDVTSGVGIFYQLWRDEPPIVDQRGTGCSQNL